MASTPSSTIIKSKFHKTGGSNVLYIYAELLGSAKCSPSKGMMAGIQPTLRRPTYGAGPGCVESKEV